MLSANDVLQKATTKLSNRDKKELLEAISRADEVVFFGSYAYGCETPESDLDVLLIGDGQKRKSKNLDLVWIPNDRVVLKTWLRSELASHVAAYGLWLKGDGDWKKKTEITKTTVNKKKLKILFAFSHLYVKMQDLSTKSRIEILSKILLDIYRLSYLIEKKAVPPTSIIKNKVSKNGPEPFYVMTHQLLGEVGTVLLRQNLCHLEIHELWQHMLNGWIKDGRYEICLDSENSHYG